MVFQNHAGTVTHSIDEEKALVQPDEIIHELNTLERLEDDVPDKLKLANELTKP